MQEICLGLKKESKSIGFVPTMGFLHAGHEALLKTSRKNNAISILSIFVNPTQFNQKEDFERYPVDLENDLSLAEKNQVDYVFLPDEKELYLDNYCYQVQENSHSLVLEGEHRQGHFTGVLTIVLKLLNTIQPDIVYLGKKDYQQYSLIKNMIAAFFLPIQVVACETIREPDGLAMSSRNVRLNEEERVLAPSLYQILSSSKTAQEAENKLKIYDKIKIEYITDFDGRRYAAIWLGNTRLIDNIELIK